MQPNIHTQGWYQYPKNKFLSKRTALCQVDAISNKFTIGT